MIKNRKIYILRFRAVDKDIWQMIKTRKKKVETRAATIRYRNIKVGDKIVFSCRNNKFERIVKKVRIYKSIKALLKEHKVKDINPSFKTVDDLVRSYHSFPGYKEKIKKYGIIALEFD